MMIRYQLIDGQVPTFFEPDNFSGLSLFDLSRCANVFEGDKTVFIDTKCVRFRAYVGHQHLTSEALVYYPALVRQLRALDKESYPWVMREYSVDATLRGIDFVKHFAKVVEDGHIDFQAVKVLASAEVEGLIQRFGNHRYVPVIDAFHKPPHGPSQIVICGVSWTLAHSWFRQVVSHEIDVLYPYDLLRVNHQHFARFDVEAVKLGTPFIAMRIARTHKHRGRIIWYNLDTRAAVSQQEMARWQHDG